MGEVGPAGPEAGARVRRAELVALWLGDDLAVKRDAHYGYDFGKAGPTAAGDAMIAILAKLAGLRGESRFTGLLMAVAGE